MTTPPSLPRRGFTVSDRPRHLSDDHDDLERVFDQLRADAEKAWAMRREQERLSPRVPLWRNESIGWLGVPEAKMPRAGVKVWVRSVLLRIGEILRGRR